MRNSLDDTGGHVLGNFPNYYSFNPSSERISVLEPSFWRRIAPPGPLSFLDIGCNSGDLTEDFRMNLVNLAGCDSIKAFGVDVDRHLIDVAESRYPNCYFKCLDFVDTLLEDQTSFDICTLFGVTMWVHLNHGDAGLVNLLEKACTYANTSVIIEPQTWNNYKKARKRIKEKGCCKPEFMNQIISGQEEVSELIDKTCMIFFHTKIIHGVTKWGRQIIEFTDKIQI